MNDRFNPLRGALLFAGLLALTGCHDMKQNNTLRPPLARQEAKELTIHGDKRIDPFYWLNQRENPEVITYLEAENAYTKKMMSHTDSLQEKLFSEITGRIPQNDVSVPYLENGYYYYTRFEEEKEYPVYCRKKGGLEAGEEVLLNVNELAKGYSFFQVGGFQVSDDNRYLAYAVDTVSRRIYDIYVKDLQTGNLLPDHIAGTAGNLCWANDNRTLFYATKDETLRMDKIWRHKMGEAAGSDLLIFHEEDVTYNTYVYKTKSRRYLVISSSSTLSDESRILDASQPDGEFRVFQPRRKDLKYEIAHSADKFFIRTNLKALNFRLMESDEVNTTTENWKEVIAHRSEVLLEDVDVFDGFLALQERKEGLTRIRIFDGKKVDYYLDFEEQAFSVELGENPEYNTFKVRYNYTSLTTPNSVFDFDTRSGEHLLMKRQEVVGGYDPEKYFTERIWAVGDDGTRIPVSIVYKKGLKKDGSNPCLLYGYGSYGASMDPWFSSVRLSLIDRGFIFALAHIRGGQEMGRQWYEDGKLLRKMNTFTDFIDCAEMMIAEGYTQPEKMYAMGGSAGGLLMGAVINMKPELFRGVVAAVPFVDVVTTMLDESIPLTTAEYDEWGNPNNPEYYRYMLSYSPYDNVKAVEYPALLVTTGLHDSQVQYWEPAKWVAKMRVTKRGDSPLYLWTNMEFGHGGASGRFERFRETAMEYAFLLDLEGKKE